jgi:hypothetical protein
MRSCHTLRAAALCTLLVTSLSCAHGRFEEYEADPDSEDARTYELAVQNQNFDDVTLYAVSDGRRMRLGAVNGNARRTFEFRWLYQTLQIEIDVLAGRRYLTTQMLLQPGDALQLIIPPNLDNQPGFRRIS